MTEIADIAAQPLQVVLLDPIEHKGIRCHQSQAVILLNAMQWSDPGVELLVGDLASKPVQAVLPKVDIHSFSAIGSRDNYDKLC